MKKFFALSLAFLLCLISVFALADFADDPYVQDIFIPFAQKVGSMLLEDAKEEISSAGYDVKNAPMGFKIDASEGIIYLDGFNAMINGSMTKFLSGVTYVYDDYRFISSSDRYGQAPGFFFDFDTPYASLQDMIDDYNMKTGGSVSLDGLEVSLKDQIANTAETLALNYNNVSFDHCTVNQNLAVSDKDDMIVLLYLDFTYKTDDDTILAVTEGYSMRIAASMMESYPQISELTVFWDASGIMKNGFAKFSY